MTRATKALALLGCLVVAPGIGWILVFQLHVDGRSVWLAILLAVGVPPVISGVLAWIGGYGRGAFGLAFAAGVIAAALFLFTVIQGAKGLREQAPPASFADARRR